MNNIKNIENNPFFMNMKMNDENQVNLKLFIFIYFFYNSFLTTCPDYTKRTTKEKLINSLIKY